MNISFYIFARHGAFLLMFLPNVAFLRYFHPPVFIRHSAIQYNFNTKKGFYNFINPLMNFNCLRCPARVSGGPRYSFFKSMLKVLLIADRITQGTALGNAIYCLCRIQRGRSHISQGHSGQILLALKSIQKLHAHRFVFCLKAPNRAKYSPHAHPKG